MSEKYPELVFVSGPQTGQRLVLSRPLAVLGRGAGADILLSEEFVSRRQAKYELLRAGPTLENLSDRGTWINGKRFRTGKQVLLDTGDVIGVGKETQAVFVAAGGDVEAAVEAFRARGVGGKDAFGKRHQPPGQSPAEEVLLEKSAPPQEQPPPEPTKPEKRTGQGGLERKPSQLSAGDRLRVQAKARRRRVVIGLAVYLGLLTCAGIFLKVYFGGDVAEERMPAIMTNQEISDALAMKDEKITPNLFMKQQRLKDALGLYQQYGLSSSKLYEIARAFKEALAYSGRTFFEDPQNDKVYSEVLKRLTEEVTRKYRNAVILEKNKNWAEAERDFGQVMVMVGDNKNPVFKNAEAHFARVKTIRQKKAPGGRTPWGL